MTRVSLCALALLMFAATSAPAFDAPTPTDAEQQMRERIAARDAAMLERFLAESGDALAATAGEVLARHHEATGGLEAWRALRSLKMRFRGGEGGSTMALLRFYRGAELFRQEVEGAPGAAVRNAAGVWRKGPDGGWSEAVAGGYRWFGSLHSLALDPDEPGVDYELVGVEMLNHAPCYHVAQTWADGGRHDLFFSVDSGLLVERLTDYMTGPSWFSYWDYREIEGGLRLPFVQIRSVGELGPPHGIVLESVEVDPELPDALFGPAVD